MKLRVLGWSVLFVLFSTVAAWAAYCPICMKWIPEGQEYCDFHKGALIVSAATSAQQDALLKQLEASRAEYEKNLAKITSFYTDTGNAEKLRQFQTEKDDQERVRKGGVNWEDKLKTMPRAKDEIQEANALFDKAKKLQDKVIPPWGKNQRQKEALLEYQELVEKYPSSTKVDAAAFGCGEILSGADFREYRRAAHFFELSYYWNPKTTQPGTFRAAQLYMKEAQDFEKAAEMYYYAALNGPDLYVRLTSRSALTELKDKGYGKSLDLEQAQKNKDAAAKGDNSAPAPATAAPAASAKPAPAAPVAAAAPTGATTASPQFKTVEQVKAEQAAKKAAGGGQ
jgi:hypothetical protein